MPAVLPPKLARARCSVLDVEYAPRRERQSSRGCIAHATGRFRAPSTSSFSTSRPRLRRAVFCRGPGARFSASGPLGLACSGAETSETDQARAPTGARRVARGKAPRRAGPKRGLARCPEHRDPSVGERKELRRRRGSRDSGPRLYRIYSHPAPPSQRRAGRRGGLACHHPRARNTTPVEASARSVARRWARPMLYRDTQSSPWPMVSRCAATAVAFDYSASLYDL